MSDTVDTARQDRPDPGLFACLYQPPLPLSAVSAQPALAAQPVAAAMAPVSPLLAIAAEFSPRYEQHRPDLVSVDVRGLSRLFGTPKAIGGEMRREAASRGVRVHVAIATSRIAAVVLAIARPGLTVVPASGIGEALASVSLSVLEQLHEDPLPAGASAAQVRLSAEDASAAIAVLKRWGLKTFGELAALPSADLSARLGRTGRLWQAIARGEDVRPLVPLQPEERFEGVLELEWPIDAAEPLSFVLTRLLEPLSTRLERRDRGAAVLHVQLGLVTREMHACRLELPSPLRDVRTLRTLALLDLEAHPPSAAIDKVTVIIEPTPGRILQHALFTRPHPTPEQLSTLLARLGALMGQDRIGAPGVVDSFRPGAFAMTPFAIEHNATSGVRPSISDLCSPASDVRPLTSDFRSSPVSALRRCRQPIPARVAADADHRPLRVYTDRRGFAGGVVLSCAGPWRTSGAWWDDEMRDARIPEIPIRGVRDSREPAGRRHDRVPGFPAPDGVARDDDGFAWMGRERAKFDEGGQASTPRERLDGDSRNNNGLAPPLRQEVDRDSTGFTPPNRDQRIRDGGLVQPKREHSGPLDEARSEPLARSREGRLASPKREHSGPLDEVRSEPLARSREGGPVSPKREQPPREGGPWSRDEWDVALGDGAVYRIFRDRATDGWFIDGVVD